MCFDGGALARAQYARANFRISPELFIFFGARSFIADKGVLLVIFCQTVKNLPFYCISLTRSKIGQCLSFCSIVQCNFVL